MTLLHNFVVAIVKSHLTCESDIHAINYAKIGLSYEKSVRTLWRQKVGSIQ